MLRGRPGASMFDDLLTLGRPFRIGTILLDLDNPMDEQEIVQFLVHYHNIFAERLGYYQSIMDFFFLYIFLLLFCYTSYIYKK